MVGIQIGRLPFLCLYQTGPFSLGTFFFFFFFFEKWIHADILIKKMRILQYKRQDICWNTLQPNLRGKILSRSLG